MTNAQVNVMRENFQLIADSARGCERSVLLGAAGAKFLEQSISREQRRKDGVFFSGLKLADYVANRVRHLIESGATVADPTCGGGDLLLACLRLFSTGEDEASTIASWARRVKGYDLEETFVQAARLRIAALAMGTYDACENMSEYASAFTGIQEGDYLAHANFLGHTDVIVANPPYGTISAPYGCDWSRGQTQRAAVFLEVMVQHAKPGQNIVAVLPDVLRSGSRYQRWRSKIEQRCHVLDLHRYGRFGESADIDVFVLHLCKREEPDRPEICAQWVELLNPAGDTTVRDHFDVSIGPVVPHRHGNMGGWCYYLDVGSATPNAEVNSLRKRRFSGRLVEPPFLVIRRTSSPSDRQRIVPTLIAVDRPVAVENHLIVLSPRSGGADSCRLLMSEFQTNEVHNWVNIANGCRHLTKGLVESIPLKGRI